MHLDDNQQKVAQHKTGPLLVVAGAGSGKTTTIVERVANLIKSGVEPENILAITFTNKAASEMKERILRKLKNDPQISFPVYDGAFAPTVSTFHSLAVKILREFHKPAGIKKSFSIYDKEDSLKAIKQAMEQVGIDKKQIAPSLAQGVISKQKNNAISLQEYGQNTVFQTQISQIWSRYQTILDNAGALDFDDLLVKLLDLFKNNPEVVQILNQRWCYIHVDEYQDTNKVQFEIIKYLAGHGNVCVVGDMDQAIYGFRNARPENLMEFEKVFKNVQTIFLNYNYRSVKTIVEASDLVILKNQNRIPKQSKPAKKDEEKIKLAGLIDAKSEAMFVSEQIKNLQEQGVPLSEIAVLYRTNFQSRIFEEVFLKENVPYQILGTRFFNRKEIKDLLAFIKLALNEDSIVDFTRAVSSVPMGIGKKTLSLIFLNQKDQLSPAQAKKLDSFLAKINNIKKQLQDKPLSSAIMFAIQESGLKQHLNKNNEPERLDNLYELVEIAKRYDQIPDKQQALEDFLEYSALMSDQDELTDTQKVRLMTVHAAKGLEFDVVFVVGLEQGLFPYERIDNSKQDQEEERRLFYVAMTRAKKKLFLTWAFIRQMHGQTYTNEASEFIQDIPENLTEEISTTIRSQNKIGLLDDIDW